MACSRSSRISTPAPSPITKPSRSASHGRDLRCGDGVVDEGVGLLDLFFLDPLLGNEALHFPSDLTGIRARIETRDASDAGASCDQSLPGDVVADAEGRDHADAGHHYATFGHRQKSAAYKKSAEC